MFLEDNDTLVMIGDSITDCERARPVGEGVSSYQPRLGTSALA